VESFTSFSPSWVDPYLLKLQLEQHQTDSPRCFTGPRAKYLSNSSQIQYCFLILTILWQLCPAAVMLKLDKLVEPLKMTCTTKVKANSVKQEYEKQDELKR
jgi:hypothetical protein